MAKWIVVDLAFFAMDLSICVGQKKEKKKVWNLPTRLYILWIAAAQTCFSCFSPSVYNFSDMFPNEDFK
jgi:hypothetical protein